MPDIDNLMEAWPPEIEEFLSSGQVMLPNADLDIDLKAYINTLCNILDVPVQKQSGDKALTESLHVLFTLYCDFKANPHF